MNLQGIKRLLDQGVRITLEQNLRDVLAPAHMRGTWSQRWLGTLGAFAEMVYQGAQEATDVGFPATCPDDALDYVGADRDIERLPDESNGVYRERLKVPFTTWQRSGRRSGIEVGLNAYQLSDVTVYDLAAGWSDGNVNSAWRFWVVVDEPHPWEQLLASETTIASDELIAGTTMTATEYWRIRRIVHKWRSAHSTPVALVLIYGGAIASPSTIAADDLVAGGEAEIIPLTWPQADDEYYAADGVYAGWYIEPI